ISCRTYYFSFLIIRRPRRSPLFPYTTLFRSGLQLIDAIGPELVRIAFRADEQRWDAEHQLGRLRRVDLDREGLARARDVYDARRDRKSTRLNSSHRTISYAVFCLKKKKNIKT